MARANLKRLEEGKLYYSISEVCAMTGLEQHVLRYWESEFPQLRPKKNRSGNRAYRAKEIKIIRYIKYLLYDELYTIPGAKKKMADANVADLEGQMTLLRVPALRVQEPAAASADGRGAAGPRLTSHEVQDEGDLSSGDGSHPELPEAAPGPESAATEERLRGELERLRADLKTVLAALEAAGNAAAAGRRSA